MKTLPPLPETLKKQTLTDPEWDYLLAQHPYGLPLTPDDCPTCKGAGQFLNLRDKEVYKCDCRTQWQIFMLLTYAGIAKRYQQYSWQDTENVNPDVLKSVLTYALTIEDFIAKGMGLLLFGDNKGTGKTLLATLVAKTAIAKGFTAVFVGYPDMIDMYSNTWGGDKEERAIFERRIRSVEVLVVDDVGREHANRSHTADVAFDTVLRARVAAMRPTIVTTNLSVAQLKTRYSENIVSLLDETARAYEVIGTDYRSRSRDALLDEIGSKAVRPVTFG